MRYQPSRRQMIRSLAASSLLLPGIVQHCLAAGVDAVNPLAPRASHHRPRAKRVIFMYMSGGVSHMDSFDYKPKLFELGGKPPVGNARPLVRPLWDFKQRGESGMWVSELFPHIAGVADEICLINSMKGDHNDHFQATLGIHTGSVSFARPSIGSWVSYGLGTENQNLPSFVVLAPKLPYAGSQVWSSDFLPGAHQGTRVLAGAEPIADLSRRSLTQSIQESELSLLERFNRKHQSAHPTDPMLAARIKSFETAFGMQMAMPEVLDLAGESDSTLDLYGLKRGSTEGFGWQCLVARRLAERGVRFIELIDTGSSNNWDSHSDMKAHGPLAKNVDQPIAGLIRDLKLRGMLDETLIVWTTEFGRTPNTDGPYGRSHHARAFSSFLAGGGTKAGYTHGRTDDLGADVASGLVHVHDFHATILHLLGFDHERLTYRHAGRDFRLTDVHGKVITDLLA